MDNQQEAVNQLLGQFKSRVLMLLNETADEFDARELTDAQREIYNDFTGQFGQKVLAIKMEIEK
jgi:hypothetical protein